MSSQKLNAEARKVTGRKVKQLRREGVVPANVYGKNVKSMAIKVKLADFEPVYAKAGETSLVELVVGKETKPVLVHEVQVHPVTDEVLHVDFFQVNLKEKVTANVPVELIGESPADKQGLGILVQQLDEVEVEALPTNLPDKFEVDISGLEAVDSALTVADLKVDAKKVEVQNDPEQIIVKVEPLREEEEEPAPTAEDEEGAEAEDGKAPAEDAKGEEKPAEGGEEEASE